MHQTFNMPKALSQIFKLNNFLNTLAILIFSILLITLLLITSRNYRKYTHHLRHFFNSASQKIRNLQNPNANKTKTTSIKLLPIKNKIYLASFPDFGGSEDNVTTNKILNFESIINHNIAWVYFSINFKNGIKLSQNAINEITKAGAIPFIRLMPRSSFDYNNPEKIYTLQNIVNGEFNKDLINLANQVKNLKFPVLITFAPEPNGNWFKWSGVFNNNKNCAHESDKCKGPKLYKQAYKHIINIFRKQNVKNVTWFFHVNLPSVPNESWNKPKNYYPGDDYIDWIGVSIYGALTPQEDWIKFENILKQNYIDVLEISQNKPIALLEFGVTDYHPKGNKAIWLTKAVDIIKKQKYIPFKAIGYWHENWEEKDGVFASLRLDSSYQVFNTARKIFNDPIFTAIPKFSNFNLKNNYTKVQFKHIKNWLDYQRFKIQNAKNWYWQLQGKPSIYTQADIIDIDPEQVSKKYMQQLKAQNKFVVCYLSAGTAEKFRDDFKQFPKQVLGKPMEDWQDEIWLDIRKFNLFANIIKQKIKFAYKQGCDAIEADNIDGYDNNTGFNLTKNDAIKYINWLVQTTHSYNMLYALKNGGDIVNSVKDIVDLAIVEECQKYNECKLYLPFIRLNKPVLAVEYNVSKYNIKNVCTKFKQSKFLGGIACYDLNGCFIPCKSYNPK